MSKGVTLAQNQGDFYPCSNLHTLNGIQKQQLELLVKLVKRDGVFKAASREKIVRPYCPHNFPKGIPVSTQSVIAIAMETVNSGCLISYLQTTFFDKCKLTSKGQIRF